MTYRGVVWCVLGLAAAGAAGAAGQEATSLRAGVIAGETGGAPGYQHGLEQSHFAVGAQAKAVSGSGWSRQTGPSGTFAVSLHNGVVMAVPDAHYEHKTGALLDPVKHDQQVMQYFTAAGVPKDQISGVHTMTRLSASGHKGDLKASPPKVDGYVSVLERSVDGVPVPDSMAWAQLDSEGAVISEGVYWPAIPAEALANARRMRETMTAEAGRRSYLARVPSTLPPGKVVIRHSSAGMQQGAFEALASYDVQDRAELAAPGYVAAKGGAGGSVVMRHFDVNGVEQRLPQERRNAEKAYPAREKVAPAAASAAKP